MNILLVALVASASDLLSDEIQLFNLSNGGQHTACLYLPRPLLVKDLFVLKGRF